MTVWCARRCHKGPRSASVQSVNGYSAQQSDQSQRYPGEISVWEQVSAPVGRPRLQMGVRQVGHPHSCCWGFWTIVAVALQVYKQIIGVRRWEWLDNRIITNRPGSKGVGAMGFFYYDLFWSFIYAYMCVPCVKIPTEAQLNPLELELQSVVRHLMWVLGIELSLLEDRQAFLMAE